MKNTGKHGEVLTDSKFSPLCVKRFMHCLLCLVHIVSDDCEVSRGMLCARQHRVTYQAVDELLDAGGELLEALLDIAREDADLAGRHARAQVLQRAQPLLRHALAQLLHALLRSYPLLLHAQRS